MACLRRMSSALRGLRKVARPAQCLSLALLLIVGGAVGTGWWWARGVAGAGALHQYAPTAVKPGAPFEIKVLAGAWGAGREAPLRYSGWLLQLQQGGHPLGPPMAPSRTGLEGGRAALYFELRAPISEAGRGAALTWQLRFNFDGQAHQVPGAHSIKLLSFPETATSP